MYNFAAMKKYLNVPLKQSATIVIEHSAPTDCDWLSEELTKFEETPNLLFNLPVKYEDKNVKANR